MNSGRLHQVGVWFDRAGALERRCAEQRQRQPTVRDGSPRIAAVRRRRGHVLNRASGFCDHRRHPRRRAGFFARRRVAGTGRDGRAHVDVRDYSWAGAIIRSSVLGSSSGRARLAPSCRTSSAPGRGDRSCHRRAAGGHGVVVVLAVVAFAPALIWAPGLSLVCGERRRVLTCHRVGLSATGLGTRRLAGHSDVRAFPDVPQVIAQSSGRPTAKWSRRA